MNSAMVPRQVSFAAMTSSFALTALVGTRVFATQLIILEYGMSNLNSRVDFNHSSDALESGLAVSVNDRAAIV